MKHGLNKRSVMHWLTWGVTGITLVLWLPLIISRIVMVINLFKVKQKASSIGIIGGADGPTAIFVTSKIGPPGLILGGFLLLMLVMTITLWIIKVRINKKERGKHE